MFLLMIKNGNENKGMVINYIILYFYLILLILKFDFKIG
jgi:hypothetical protein